VRLVDANPKWVGIDPQKEWHEPAHPLRFGIVFACPHCGRRLGVMFKPFIDPDNFAPKILWALPGAPNPNTGEVKDQLWWTRTGDNFENLSLSPSINAEGHWHGTITNGELIPDATRQ